MPNDEILRMQREIETLKGNTLALELILCAALASINETDADRARCADSLGDLFELIQRRHRFNSKPAFHDGIQTTFANVAHNIRYPTVY